MTNEEFLDHLALLADYHHRIILADADYTRFRNMALFTRWSVINCQPVPGTNAVQFSSDALRSAVDEVRKNLAEEATRKLLS